MTFADDRSATMESLKRALPYVRLFRGKAFVVKIGGAPCSDARLLRDLCEQLCVVRELGVHVRSAAATSSSTVARISESTGASTRPMSKPNSVMWCSRLRTSVRVPSTSVSGSVSASWGTGTSSVARSERLGSIARRW